MKKYSVYFALVPLLFGVSTTAGWILSIEFLKNPFQQDLVMTPMAAAAFTRLCVAFIIFRAARPPRWLLAIAYFFAALVVVMSSIKLLVVFGVDLQPDFWLVRIGLITPTVPGQVNPMGLGTATNFLLTGTALLFSRTGSRRLKMSINYLVLIAFIIAMFSFIGYIYGIKKNYGILNDQLMSMQTSVCFLFVALAFFYQFSDTGFMKIISAPLTGGRLARIVLPVGICVPLFFGYIALTFAKKADVSLELGMAALVTGIVVCFIIVLAVLARSMNKADKARQQSEELYQKMVLEVQDYSILLLDINGNITNWNAGAEKIKGYRAEEIIGKNFRIFYPPAQQEKGLPEKLLHTALTEGRVTDEGWRVRKDGSIFWGHVTITALHDERGNVIGLSKVTRDLTERRTAEVELEQQAALIKMVPDGIITSTRSRKFVDLNAGAERLFDLVRDEVIGKDIDDYISLSLQSGVDFKTAFADLWKTGFWRGEIEIVNKRTGKTVNVLTNIKAVDNVLNGQPGFIAIYTDLSVLRMNDELKLANNYLEQLAFISAHDIKSPIHTLEGLTDILLKTDGLNANSFEIVKMQSNVVRQMQLTNTGLNEILKLRKGLISGEITTGESLSLAIILDNVLTILKPGIEKTGARLHIDLGDAAEIKFPFYYLQSVFHNLIANAIKYRSAARIPEIYINAKTNNLHTVNITISDNGLGFDMVRNKNKVFGIFKRFHSEVEGTGVGLHIVKSIVEAYGGEINVSSEEDKGTIFEISIKVPGFA